MASAIPGWFRYWMRQSVSSFALTWSSWRFRPSSPRLATICSSICSVLSPTEKSGDNGTREGLLRMGPYEGAEVSEHVAHVVLAHVTDGIIEGCRGALRELTRAFAKLGCIARIRLVLGAQQLAV